MYIAVCEDQTEEPELSQTTLSQQLDVTKGQIAFLNETQTQTAIYQHNMRHCRTASWSLCV